MKLNIENHNLTKSKMCENSFLRISWELQYGFCSFLVTDIKTFILVMAQQGSRTRPFDGMTDEEIKSWQAAEYQELQKINDDGVDFVGKTASMIAYERMLESERPEGDRLFNDHLAKHFAEPYGKRVSDCVASGLIVFFDPNRDIGLLFDGHVAYTAVRTRLINDFMGQWINSCEGEKQVVDLGAGYSTRAFWVEALKNVTLFTEVDSKAVSDAKEKVLSKLECAGQLSKPLCRRNVVTLDFAKQSVADLPSFGYNQLVATCWILEGLVMYLKPEETARLLEEVSDLSVKGSYIILNFFQGAPGSNPDEMDRTLEAKGWSKEDRVYFGDAKFNYGRYPEGKPANTIFGFSFYAKS